MCVAVGTLNSGLPHLIDKLRYVLYGKHRRTFIDASSSAHGRKLYVKLFDMWFCQREWQVLHQQCWSPLLYTIWCS